MSFEMMKLVAELREQIQKLEERIAALEQKKGPGRPPSAEKAAK